jgi:hypothetical protein
VHGGSSGNGQHLRGGDARREVAASPELVGGALLTRACRR